MSNTFPMQGQQGLAVCLAGLLLFGLPLPGSSVESIGGAEPPKAARSVHLQWTAPECEAFYNEMVVEQSTAGSYFMACGWNGGYFGIQEISPERKVAIFSVWDTSRGDDPGAVKNQDRVELLHQGEGVRIKRFGGEGTGGQCMLDWPWEIGQTNRFLVRSRSAGGKTAFAGYLFDDQTGKWRHLVTFSRPGTGALRGLYSFVEDFRRDGRSVGEVRRAGFRNAWVKAGEAGWQVLANARFTASRADWEARDNINTGTNQAGWFLVTGGETTREQPLNGNLRFQAPGSPPSNLPEFAHSLATTLTPFGPVPTERQLRWHAMEFYGFLHFTVNTFTDKEWGYGDEDPKVFNPTAFNADQIVSVAKSAGMKGLILTAKHHDGFCLWPSQFTEHSVKNSPWKNGQGDIVREISDACRLHGLRFGVYLSPWDRNHKDYGRPEYLTYYRNQLRELLTNYGEVFTVWFDGANGGDGFYGGAREKRQIDNRTYYDWPNTHQLVRELMPRAVMFGDGGPDTRWVGNERGIAGDPCWATLNAEGRYAGGSSAGLNSGDRPGTHWIPAECDVSIRPGWFYHANEDAKVKTPEQLLGIYYQSVGRGACLNLNLPPDRRGQIHENDIASLMQFRRWLDATFANDLAKDAKLTASNTRDNAKFFGATNLVDQNRDSFWMTDDEIKTPELVLEFAKLVTFSVVSLREYLPLGQRVEAFALERWENGQWIEFANGTSIGNRRLLRSEPVSTSKVRLRITQAAACPAISELSLFAEPAALRTAR